MKKLYTFILSILALVACNGLGGGSIELEGSDEIEIGFNAGTVNFNVRIEGDWTIAGKYDWCRPEFDSGDTGIYTIRINVDENLTGSVRTATFTIKTSGKSQAVKLIQNPKPEFSLKGIPAKFDCDGGYYPFTVESEVEVLSEITEGQEWIKCNIDYTKGAVTTLRLALSVNANDTFSERRGKVVFYSREAGILDEVEIVQDAQPEGYISFADEVVELVCLKKYDKDGDGRLSLFEAKQVTTIPEYFFGDTYNKAVISFDELAYFSRVESIGNEAFINSSIKKISLPKSLKSIGREAFMCSGIESITLHEGIERIEYAAFENCENLKQVVIPESISFLGKDVFRYSHFLESLVLPSTVTTIPERLCEECRSLKEIEIKGEITSIGALAFFGCSSLMTLTINGPLNTIEGIALVGCKSLKSIKTKFSTADERCVIKDGELHCFAPSGLSEYTIPDGVKAILPEVFYQFDLESITIPEGVLTIGLYAFAENEHLTTMTIPSTVRSMDEGVFSDCKNLKTLVMKPSTPPASELMLRHTYFEKIIVPKGCADVYKTTAPWTNYASIIVEEE